MSRFRPYPVLVLAVWTLVLWAGRLDLAWNVTTDSFARKLLATVPVAIFVAFALIVLAALLRRGASTARRDALSGWPRRLAIGFEIWSVAYWAVRLPMILSDSHNAAFKGVHTVLAVLSWAAAAWAWNSTRTDASSPVGRGDQSDDAAGSTDQSMRAASLQSRSRS